MTACDVVSGLG